jgi:flagellin
MRINTNVSALTANRNLQNTSAAVSKSMAKLSSGFRINSASDDAAGLAIANKFRSDIRALTQASRNAEQANSVLQIAEGGAANIEKILERMKELATQSAADAVDTDGRTQINNEFLALSAEVDRITNTVKFQGDTLLNGPTARPCRSRPPPRPVCTTSASPAARRAPTR